MWKRLRKKALWPFALVALASAIGALYVMSWATFGGPTIWPLGHVDGTPEDAAPLIVGSLGVLATVCAIFAGILELDAALPRQKLKLDLVLDEDDPSRDRFFALLTAQAQGAITSRAYIESKWSVQGGESLIEFVGDHHETLYPEAEPWQVRRSRITLDQLDSGIVVKARWWTDRNDDKWTTLRIGRGDRS